MEAPEAAPEFADLDRDECSIELDVSDLFIRSEGWEYHLRKANCPSHPSLDLDDIVTELRLYDDKAVVFHDIPEWDEEYEVVFRIENVCQIGGEDN